MEVQKLLVTGRIKEALRFAQEGQLWGPALVLATQIGDQVLFPISFLPFILVLSFRYEWERKLID